MNDPPSPPSDDPDKVLLAIIAMLGVFQNRHSDLSPEYETIGKGYMALMHQVDAYQQLIRLVWEKGADYVYEPLRSDK